MLSASSADSYRFDQNTKNGEFLGGIHRWSFWIRSVKQRDALIVVTNRGSLLGLGCGLVAAIS